MKDRVIAGAALPLYLTLIASSAGAVVDTALLGRHATASLAAFAVAIAVFNPASAAVAGALRGVMPFVAEKDDDPDGLVDVVRSGMWLGVTVGFLGALAVAVVPLLGRIAGVSGVTLDALGGFPYLLAAAVFVLGLSMSATSTLVGLGRGQAVMRSGLAGTGAAVVLSLSLVPRLGLPGAGVAMLASVAINACVAHLGLRRVPVLAGRSLRLGRPRFGEVLRFARVGIPLAGTVLLKFASLGVLTLAAARISTDAAAVHSVCMSLANLIFTAAVAVGQALIPLMGQSLKEGDVWDARRNVAAGLRVAFGAVAVLGLLLVTLRGVVIPVFTSDAGIQRLVRGQLPLLLLVVAFDALQAVVGFGMIGIKRTLSSLVRFAVVGGALAVVAVPVAEARGLTGLWGALACANALLVVGQLTSFRRHSALLAVGGGAGAPVRVG
ncbi:MATE family efflux transporter [Streptomyces sp. NPDC102270]|uniref:MATE family efflux transporter n=1 Tax=Streptomyces sp. NPDC102270 TaxID=3366150 RepID=UPI0038025CE9